MGSWTIAEQERAGVESVLYTWRSVFQEAQTFWEIVLIIPNDGPAKKSGIFVGLVQSEKMDRGWQEVV